MIFQKIKIKVIIGIAFLSYSCSDLEDSYQEVVPLITVPSHFPPFVDSGTNPLTKDGVLLGKRLFHDKKLSGNNQVSCVTCHQQSMAFSDGLALSDRGISGKLLERNSPTLINLAWATNGLFWDGGSTNLESQAFAPLAHEDEMRQNLQELISELNADPIYPKLFSNAFGTQITQAGIVKALAQFQRTLISANSQYDKYILGKSGGELNPDQQKGLRLAEKFCLSCHASPLLTDNRYHNNGIDADFSDDTELALKKGRYRITHNSEDIGKFRTPTLRNIEKTAPYMHDGRFNSLENVIDHYSNGIVVSATLDRNLYLNGKPGFNFTETEKKQLLAFLKTLTDNEFLNNTKISEF